MSQTEGHKPSITPVHGGTIPAKGQRLPKQRAAGSVRDQVPPSSRLSTELDRLRNTLRRYSRLQTRAVLSARAALRAQGSSAPH